MPTQVRGAQSSSTIVEGTLVQRTDAGVPPLLCFFHITNHLPPACRLGQQFFGGFRKSTTHRCNVSRIGRLHQLPFGRSCGVALSGYPRNRPGGLGQPCGSDPVRLDVLGRVLALRCQLVDQCCLTRVCGHSCLLDNTVVSEPTRRLALLSPTRPGSPAGSRSHPLWGRATADHTDCAHTKTAPWVFARVCGK